LGKTVQEASPAELAWKQSIMKSLHACVHDF